MKDLLVLAPCVTWRATLDGLLRRPQALEIRSVTYEVRVHPGRDPGVRSGGPELIAPLSTTFGHAVLILDHEGCGADGQSPERLEGELRRRLARHWRSRGDAVVVKPEVEQWLWGARSKLGERLGLTATELDALLAQGGFAASPGAKPTPPKDALLHVLRATRTVPSANLYGEVAARASLRTDRCKSPSFGRFVARLRAWFPRAAP